MGARFIGVDREQVFLMPPSVRDWVPEGHLVWTVLDAVGELDLSAFYARYRADGHGRPAYEPSMMVALLLYAYARGNRSSRGIERACVEDVAYRVVAGNLVPDHSTIAEFRCRHERRAGRGVLRRARAVRAGRAGVGRGGGDRRDEDVGQRVDERQPRLRADRARDPRARRPRSTGARTSSTATERGDELPEQLRTREGRRQALREAKERLQREREQAAETRPTTTTRIGRRSSSIRSEFVTRPQGRRAWVREGRRALEAQRERERRPIARDRAERLFEACRRLEEELDVEHASQRGL